MTEDTPHWLSGLPRGLQQRFSSLGKYVEEAVKARATERASRALTPQELSLLKVGVIATRLTLFMEKATRVGERAVAVMCDLGAEGFAVGGATFKPGSQDLRRGSRTRGCPGHPHPQPIKQT